MTVIHLTGRISTLQRIVMLQKINHTGGISLLTKLVYYRWLRNPNSWFSNQWHSSTKSFSTIDYDNGANKAWICDAAHVPENGCDFSP